MADSDYRSCMEGHFLTFVIVTDTSHLLDGSKWGWLINEERDQAAFDPISPGFPPIDEFNGAYRTRALAEDAAVRYIWAKRPDIVKSCQREYNAGKAYRLARSQ